MDLEQLAWVEVNLCGLLMVGTETAHSVPFRGAGEEKITYMKPSLLHEKNAEKVK